MVVLWCVHAVPHLVACAWYVVLVGAPSGCRPWLGLAAALPLLYCVVGDRAAVAVFPLGYGALLSKCWVRGPSRPCAGARELAGAVVRIAVLSRRACFAVLPAGLCLHWVVRYVTPSGHVRHGCARRAGRRVAHPLGGKSHGGGQAEAKG